MNSDVIAPPCRHPFNDAHLLCILGAEERLVGAYKIKESRDNGCHTSKVSGSGGTLESRSERTWISCWHWLIGWVDLVNVWDEE
jgi:hypothetical protein